MDFGYGIKLKGMRKMSEKSTGLKNKLSPFGMKDKMGYMFGDLGNTMFFGFIGAYLMVFYTDVVGISGAAVATLLVVSRIWDAINDPILGTFVDSRQGTKIGKFRPYLWRFAIPVIFAGILVFTTPTNGSEGIKLGYAYFTYILFGMMYTCINIPYGSLSSVMTNDPVERTALSTFRSVGSLVGNLIIMALVPLLIFENKIPTQKGFFKAAIILGIIGLISYRLSYKMVTERIVHAVGKKEKLDFKKIMLGIFKNRGLMGVMLLSLAQLTSMMLSQSLTVYLYKDYFRAPELVGIAGAAGMAVSFMVLPMLGPLVKKFGKKELVSYGMILSTTIYFALYLLPVTNPYIYTGFQMVAALGMAFSNVLVWAIVADAIDYHEFLTGERKEGIVYASYSLVRKLGQAAAGGIGGIALTYIGYISGAATQSPETALGIKQMATLVPGIAGIIGIIGIMFVCNLSKERLVKLNEELEEIRK